MKTIFNLIPVILLFVSISCGQKPNTQNDVEPIDTISVPDTGYTGIKQYYSNKKIAGETTFKNGVRQGISKTFYEGGQIRQTFWYENGIREDSAKWYYTEGQVFRSTPYKRDTIHGIQVQYFRKGPVKAKIGFEKGLRTFFFEEYTPNGQLIKNYPDVIISAKDNYNSNGSYNISLELSDKSKKVKYFRGDFSTGVYDTTKVSPIRIVNGIGNLTLKKTSAQTKPYVEIVATILTDYGNSYLLLKKIELPYNDLN